MKSKFIKSVLLLSLFFSISCRTISVDSFISDRDAFSAVDSLYIKDVKIESVNRMNIRKSLCHSLSFSLRKRAFNVRTFLDPGARQESCRYSLCASVFISRYGDLLDEKTSTTVFVQLTDKRNGGALATIRLSCRGCELRDEACQGEICGRIAVGLDRLIRKEK